MGFLAISGDLRDCKGSRFPQFVFYTKNYNRLVCQPADGLFYYKLDSPLMDRMFYVVLPDRRYTSHATKMFIQYFLVNFI